MTRPRDQNETRVSFRLPKVLADRIRQIARDQHRSVSAVCRILVEEAVRDVPSMSSADIAVIVMPPKVIERAKKG